MSLLEVKGLTVHYHSNNTVIKAVNSVSFKIEQGQTLGLVGETGAGKTTTALAILRLLSRPQAEICGGEILLNGKDLLKMRDGDMRKIRGNDISMIFQDPMTALNPIMKVGDQISEVIELHQGCSKKESVKKSLEMLEMVGIRPERATDYPHQFSGGMKQRVVIAMALACNPILLLADEPTTALDVTIQAQVLDMMNDLKKKLGTSVLMITHDLGIVAESCDDVAIMYAGEIMEYGSLPNIFKETAHPYTKGLFNSLPSLNKKMHRLMPIRGLMPDPANLPSGCPFHPRCPYADEQCASEVPPIHEFAPGHLTRCHHDSKGYGLYFPDEAINEKAYEDGYPVSNPGNDILGKGAGPSE